MFKTRHRQENGAWAAQIEGEETLKISGEEPLRREIAAFLEVVERRGASPVDVNAGLSALRVVEAAVRSSRQGCRVVLNSRAPGGA